MQTEHIEPATQLRHPQGEEGIHIGPRLQQTNADMLQRSLQLLQFKPHDRILELGPGNGTHVPALLSSVEGLSYTGIDISETVIRQARSYCGPWVNINKAHFVQGNGVTIPYPDNYFNRILAVNVVYFWGNPLQNLKEIYRALKPQGVFCLAFRSKTYMQELPFNAHDFRLYDTEEAQKLLEQTGFCVQEIHHETDEGIGILRNPLPKEQVLILAQK